MLPLALGLQEETGDPEWRAEVAWTFLEAGLQSSQRCNGTLPGFHPTKTIPTLGILLMPRRRTSCAPDYGFIR